MAALVTARWGPSQHNLSTEVPLSYHLQGCFRLTACHRRSFHSPQQMLSTRLTYLQKVELEERSTSQCLLGPSHPCYQIRCPSLATLAGPNPTGPAGTLPKQSTPHHHRAAKNHPLEALRIEAGVPNTATKAQRQAAVAYEKAHCLPTNYHRKTLLEEPCRHRLTRPSWRSTAKGLMDKFPDAISSKDALQTLL